MILTIDDTQGNNEQIDNPTFTDVEDAILGLDGVSRTQVGLFVDNETFVQVGGGRGLCTCSIRMNAKLYTLVDRDLSADEYVWLVAGQGDEVPRNQCIEASDVVRVVKLFWDKRELSDEYAWKSF